MDNLGMTNLTKIITLDNKTYVFRIPGKGTEKLINRQQEYNVYQTIKEYNISDEVLYFDIDTGIKISKYVEESHNCDSSNFKEVKLAMNVIKHLHSLNLKVDFEFDLRKMILYYESLMNKSKYDDYEEIKKLVFDALDIIATYPKQCCLCHIDPNQDNILIDNHSLKVNAIIDWEYAAMQNPLLDVAMFGIYAGYDRPTLAKLLQLYKDDVKPTYKEQVQFYTYVAAAGLLWSNWCEYKLQLNEKLDEKYVRSQYEYAKYYSNLVRKLVMYSALIENIEAANDEN